MMAKAIDKLTSQMKQQNLLEFLNKSVAEMVETYSCSSYWIIVEVVTGTVIYKLWSIYINQATQGFRVTVQLDISTCWYLSKMRSGELPKLS